MIHKTLCFLLALVIAGNLSAQTGTYGIFESGVDIGKPKLAGSSHYDEATQTYHLKGGGYNIWFQRDEFHYLYKKLKGDFIVTANFQFKGKGIDPHRKIGWMIRESIEPDASHISAVNHGDGLTVLQWRVLRGAYMRDPEDEIFTPKKDYSIIQLERKGNVITMRVAHSGEPLQTIGSQAMDNFKDEVLAGLFICSHNPDVAEEASVWNVRIDQPVPDTYTEGEDEYMGSRLEIINIADGHRKIVHESDKRFEAPNWMPDGKRLLFNMQGLLYTIPVVRGNPEIFDTGFANGINNNHGISFDGKTLAISHHREGLPAGGSTIYVLPVTGGTPKMVVDKTPSYWHGWATNNKEIVYTAQRDGKKPHQIYRASVAGGKEVQLTFHENGHVDGPEYSPDGKYIYYNGSQSGTMQLWRMKPDGSGNEQLTFDENNNWFPHVSPDGQWIAFISFPSDIAPDEHPLYKHVSLKVMPVSGGAPKVIAYVYGGQGTLNSPSWSPDSKQLAFVSTSSGKK